MIVGVPSVGIGGLFYVCSALWMPIRCLRTAMNGEPAVCRWRVVTLQVTISFAILVGIWMTGWALAELVAMKTTVAGHLNAIGGDAPVSIRTIVTVGMFTAGLTMLATVLVGVQLLRLLVHGRSRKCPTLRSPEAIGLTPLPEEHDRHAGAA